MSETPADKIRLLDSLGASFRSSYLRNAEIAAQLAAWAQAFPDLVRVDVIGHSLDGEPIRLLTIGPDPDRARPAAWVDGNMHASELAGSSVALAIAQDVIRTHLDPEAELHGLPPHVRARIRDVLVYVLPRMSPDGAEAVLRDGRYVRSVPRDRRPNKQHARWVSSDVDGDGMSLLMRKRDDGGEYVESTEMPGLLLPRRIEDEGPFYKVYPEGHIEHFDGATIPDPYFLSDTDVDLNRNFPADWGPDHEQEGAGPFAASEPESRAVIEFATKHPEIFVWLNLHTFGGVFIRPMGAQADKKMDEQDLALFRQIGASNEEQTGYPTVSGFEEFLYAPDKPLKGDLSEYAYLHRGAIGYVAEIWDIFKQLGIARKKPFVDHYNFLTRAEMVKLSEWDRDHNQSRIGRPWTPCKHPQLGDVEVGGVDIRVGISNPPYEMLGDVCRQHVAAFMRVVAMAPKVAIDRIAVVALGGGLHRVDVTVKNHGYLPTYFLSSAKKLAWNEPLSAEVNARGCEVVDAPNGSSPRRPVGHLDGWGRGLFDGTGSILSLRSRGNTGEKTLRVIVRGAGQLSLRIGSCRVGWIEETIAISA